MSPLLPIIAILAVFIFISSHAVTHPIEDSGGKNSRSGGSSGDSSNSSSSSVSKNSSAGQGKSNH